MSSSDEFQKRQAKCRQDCAIISKQFPVLMEKLEAVLDPPKKKQKRSAKKSEAEKSAALTSSRRAACKDLAKILRGFLEELGDEVVEEEEEAGGSSTAPAPLSVEDKNN